MLIVSVCKEIKYTVKGIGESGDQEVVIRLPGNQERPYLIS